MKHLPFAGGFIEQGVRCIAPLLVYQPACHDHIRWKAQRSQSIAEPNHFTVLIRHFRLDDEEVHIAVGSSVTAGV